MAGQGRPPGLVAPPGAQHRFPGKSSQGLVLVPGLFKALLLRLSALGLVAS